MVCDNLELVGIEELWWILNPLKMKLDLQNFATWILDIEILFDVVLSIVATNGDTLSGI